MAPSPAAAAHRITRGQWAIYAGIFIAAALTRFLALGRHLDTGGTPIFDEKHYVPQAWQALVHADHSLLRMLISGTVPDNPGYGLVVHPPLAKEIMAVGMALFGYTPYGWRSMSAAAGVATVMLIVACARHLALPSGNPVTVAATMIIAGALAVLHPTLASPDFVIEEPAPLGTAGSVGTILVVPVAGGIEFIAGPGAVDNGGQPLEQGSSLGHVPVDRGDYRGPVSVTVDGDTLIEQRGDTVTLLTLSL